MIVWLASYPRSGNSFLRTVIHTIYGFPSVTVYKEPLPPGEIKESKHPWKAFTSLTVEQMAASNEQFLVKTHDLPPDEIHPAIYVVREGRASLVSYANLVLSKKNGAEPDHQSPEFQSTLRHLMTDQRSPFGTWSQNVSSWVQRPNTAVLRFEDLIQSPDGVEDAQKKLNLGWQRIPGAKMPPFADLQRSRPVSFRRGNATAWKDELSVELQDLFLREHGAVMEQMGYLSPDSANMSEITVTEVISATTGLEPLLGFHLDYPAPGACSDAWSLDIGGWVLGRESTAAMVEVTHLDRVIRQAEVWMPRTDVAGKLAITDAALSARAAASGFHASVNLLGLPEHFLLQVEAVLGDRSRVILGTVAGTRRKFQPAYQPRLLPITLTHLARSGSTWLTHLLAEHPGVVVHRRYPFEDVTALYGMRMLDVLSTPCNPLQQADVHEMKETLDHIGPLPLFCQHEDPPMHAWVRRQYVERLASFSMEWVDAFYGEVAARQKKPQARYYSEKLFQNSRHSDLFAEMYPSGREVFLIRDFRDVLCSSFSFRVEKKEMEHMILKFRGRVGEILHGWKTRGSRGHLLRYEDLIRKPVETLQALFNYLQLDSDAPLMNRLLEKATRATPDLTRHQTAGGQQLSVRRWERDMDAAQQDLCRDHLGEALQAFGY